MSCEHYWRDGILLTERGEPDPHDSTCVDCRRARGERDELVRALPRVGATSTGDPNWQARVWSRIAREETAKVRRSYWLGGGVAAACAVVAVYLYVAGGKHPQPDQPSSDRSVVDEAGRDRPETPERAPSVPAQPRIEIVSGQLAMRSTSARVGDRVRITVDRGQEVRTYRADRLMLRCRAQSLAPGCKLDARELIAEAELATAGDYQLVVIRSATADPGGTLDADLAAVVSAGGDYKVTELSVR